MPNGKKALGEAYRDDVDNVNVVGHFTSECGWSRLWPNGFVGGCFTHVDSIKGLRLSMAYRTGELAVPLIHGFIAGMCLKAPVVF